MVGTTPLYFYGLPSCVWFEKCHKGMIISKSNVVSSQLGLVAFWDSNPIGPFIFFCDLFLLCVFFWGGGYGWL